jgi:hypothetical protein
MMNMAFWSVPLLIFAAFGPSAASAPPPPFQETGTTTINFVARAGIDDTLNVLEGAEDPRTMSVHVHVHGGDPVMGICVTGSVTLTDGEKTRRQLAQEMANQLKEDLVKAGLTMDEACALVKVDGATITVCDTPKKGPNTGDFDDNDGDGEPDTIKDPPDGDEESRSSLPVVAPSRSLSRSASAA